MKTQPKAPMIPFGEDRGIHWFIIVALLGISLLMLARLLKGCG